mmetsp:Transcript_7065/g.12591  ORF Transcript_7065/g.12591 Transcript_7065/m.12591 type:complete len:107 (+) Transcript_7065:421-741(+)
MIETQYPLNSCLNINLATQASATIPDAQEKLSGKSTTTFTGQGEVTSTIGSHHVTGKLSRSKDYFFVLDTAGTSGAGQVPEGNCKIKVKNLKLTGTVPSGSCTAFV